MLGAQRQCARSLEAGLGDPGISPRSYPPSSEWPEISLGLGLEEGQRKKSGLWNPLDIRESHGLVCPGEFTLPVPDPRGT